MTQTVQRAMTWSDLGVDRTGCVVSGVFAVDGSSYEATFATKAELGRFLDFALSSPVKPATTRLYLHPDEVPTKPEHQVSNLRFQFDPDHEVAAAVLLVIDRSHRQLLSWRTVGDAGRSDVVLAHDSWNEHETRLPAESFITVPQLSAAVMDWAFGNVVPPPVVAWVEVGGIDWF
jgi:hypothetical protein